LGTRLACRVGGRELNITNAHRHPGCFVVRASRLHVRPGRPHHNCSQPHANWFDGGHFLKGGQVRVGPDLTRADAYATAVFVMGLDGIAWTAARPGYEAYVITHDDMTYWTPGFPHPGRARI